MRGLQGKRIVIAGGATGIGAATAGRLAEEGASVVVGDINVAEAKATAKGITEAGGTAIAVEFDLGDEATIQALVDRTVAAVRAPGNGPPLCRGPVVLRPSVRDEQDLGGQDVGGEGAVHLQPGQQQHAARRAGRPRRRTCPW
ncbi:SDR family NAD(P)-dependent oxidoreductase [Streptomyces sp. NBC_00481]|uniref:SDR family NAD(P)-dependent oxidoreductase n=1 Tax=Streptomyces sp. NBC_00481 TaxID=2975755 RepID=UPI002DD910C9|nr:SDR family NAD(P)-dependent oxidoreductase [Streptomyces sp. NBC_00481]WRZ00911.1 SDR family NAD(P)-dependent oxidoreductase [Streptomyces sp. NBC_00481]